MNIINNRFYIGELPATDIMQKFEAPIYAYDEDVIRFKCQEFKDSFTTPIMIFYAAGANPCRRILEIVKEEGCGITALTQSELSLALEVCFEPRQILYSPVSPTDAQIKLAVKSKVMISIGSLQLLERYGKLAKDTAICIRINPILPVASGVSAGSNSRFGIGINELQQALQIAANYSLKIVGLHQHIGSDILSTNALLNSVGILLAAARTIPNLQFINFGGGFGIPTVSGQKPFDLKSFGAKASQLLNAFSKSYPGTLSFIFEPGRFLVAEAGALLCSILEIKKTPKHTFVFVNTNTMQLPSPLQSNVHYPIVSINEAEQSQLLPVIVCGNLQDSRDLFTVAGGEMAARLLPSDLKEGDVLALTVAGAYAQVNSSQKLQTIFVKGKTMQLMKDNPR